MKSIFSLLLMLLLVGCQPRVFQHGHMVDLEMLDQVYAGVTSKEDLRALIGSPSSEANFGENSWYYIGRVNANIAFFQPELKEQQVLIVYFDDQDVVEKVDILGLESARDVQAVERKTPTPGRRMSVLEQLLGNVGRFEGGRPKK